jgi:hypothetical protein
MNAKRQFSTRFPCGQTEFVPASPDRGRTRSKNGAPGGKCPAARRFPRRLRSRPTLTREPARVPPTRWGLPPDVRLWTAPQPPNFLRPSDPLPLVPRKPKSLRLQSFTMTPANPAEDVLSRFVASPCRGPHSAHRPSRPRVRSVQRRQMGTPLLKAWRDNLVERRGRFERRRPGPRPPSLEPPPPGFLESSHYYRRSGRGKARSLDRSGTVERRGSEISPGSLPMLALGRLLRQLKIKNKSGQIKMICFRLS